MAQSNYSLKYVSTGLLLSFYCSVPVLADDTEIYTTLSATALSVQPNVLFVLDTSGSMSSNKITVQDAYDPSTTYADAGCVSNKVYYSGNGTAPSCGSGKYFNNGKLNCNHALKEYNVSGVLTGNDGAFITQGYYLNKLTQFRGGSWKNISTNNDTQRSKHVECLDDQAIHGKKAAPTPDTYIKNSAAKWGNTQTILTWPGKQYTIYSSNYLNYLQDPSTTRLITRFQAVKEAIASILGASSNINVGLMGFNGDAGFSGNDSPDYDGGQILYAMEDIATARTPLTNFVLDPSFKTNSWTPLSEVYYEALHYFAGKAPPYGTGVSASPASVAASLQLDSTYKSPITVECQKNHIVFLTDGDPTRDTLSTTQLGQLAGYTDMSCASTVETTTEGDQAIIDGNCLDRLAGWAFNNDVADEPGAAHTGEQTIITNTVGFGNGLTPPAIEMLERTAANGGGTYTSAQNSNELIAEFNKIFAKILSRNTTFSSPAVSVNAFNRSTHLDDLYFTLFKPFLGPHWSGNLKKYKLEFEADGADGVDDDGDGDMAERVPFIAGVGSSRAVDKASGFFADNSQSFWTVGIDGPDVEAGGAAGQFPASRNVYTYTGSYTDTNGVFQPTAALSDLTATANEVRENNAAITDGVMLNIGGLPEKITGIPLRETLLDWAAGIDVLDSDGDADITEARLEMGDPLHSQPALVQYKEVAGVPDLVAYVATNDGYLHAIDTTTGIEIFSFIPQELLSNLNDVMDNSLLGKTYGLDGDVVAWIEDTGKDGTIDGSDHVYLYIGMRRGGNNIYSIDVTNRTQPKLRWVIKGGAGDFANLGQTWSNINVEKIKQGNTEKTVLIFGGGYDTNQDGATVRTADAVGNSVYIVDAETGELLWSAGKTGDTILSEMNYSIPARVKPLDLSGDGFIDRLYVADMGGQIFRFDIDNTNGALLASSVSGGRIANLAGSGAANARRFYYPPDVALIAEDGKAPFLAVAITSGYRAHPNNLDIHDRIYLIKDNDVYNTPSPYFTVTEAQLEDLTLNLVAGDGTDAQNDNVQMALDDANNRGWFIELDDETNSNTFIGEKGMAEVLILDGVLIATTFTPNDLSTANTSCDAVSGIGRVFFIDVLDGSAAFPSNADVRSERVKKLAKGGIPPSPNVIITKGGKPTMCIGTECVPVDLSSGVRKTFWYEVEK